MTDLNTAIANEGDPQIRDLLLSEKRRQEISAELLAKDPSLPFLTAVVMGNDLASAERNAAAVEAGTLTAERAVWLTGSYARLDMAVRMVDAGHLPEGWLLDNLPDLWRGADPDDTDPRYLDLWRKARQRRYADEGLTGPIHDGELLPEGEYLTVYRGQMPDAPLGIAWSLDFVTATKFAAGAGMRTPMQGILLTGSVHRRDVLAYLTQRGEAEVIIDPATVKIEDSAHA